MTTANDQRSAPAGIAVPAEWPPPARALLERAIRRHGGLPRFERLAAIELGALTLGGPLPRAKGLGPAFRPARSVRVEPLAERALFRGYPRPGAVGLYDRGDVRFVDAATGATIVASRDHEATFGGFAKHRRWSSLDALFFFGRALCDYHSLPFALARARFVRMRSAASGGERWSGLEVDLPAERRTHCRRQTFFFDESGLLRRHDYVSEVISRLARGCHFWEGWTTAEGLPLALERRVVVRVLGRPTPLVVLAARFDGATVELASPPTSKDRGDEPLREPRAPD